MPAPLRLQTPDPPTQIAPAPRALARRAALALKAEALLTPKPALVDRRGSGAHHDLDLPCLLRSAKALQPGFERMAQRARGNAVSLDLREALGAIGRETELAMLDAAGGSNAHRGAIWVLGLLVAALSMSPASSEPAAIASIAASLAQLPDRAAPVTPTHGSQVCARYGVSGARGEAQAGFPHVIRIGLPALCQARRRGLAERHARLDTLMAIMATLEDTCLLHRGGPDALAAAQHGAREVLQQGGSSTAEGHRRLLALDAQLIARWVSPGGSADLLAACLLLETTPETAPWKS